MAKVQKGKKAHKTAIHGKGGLVKGGMKMKEKTIPAQKMGKDKQHLMKKGKVVLKHKGKTVFGL